MTKQQFIKQFIKGWKEECEFFMYPFNERVARKFAYNSAKGYVRMYRKGHKPNEIPF